MWVPSSLTSWCMTSSILWSGPNSSVAGTSAPDNISLWDVVCRSIWGEKKKAQRLQNVIAHFINYFKIKSSLSNHVQEYPVKSIKPNFYFSDKWSFIIHRIAIFPAICILAKDLKKKWFQYAHQGELGWYTTPC